MAFVLLPCDLPTWPIVKKILNEISVNPTASNVSRSVWKLHEVCQLGNGKQARGKFEQLETFFKQVQYNHFLKDIPTMVDVALKLEIFRATEIINYMLQQEESSQSIPRLFAASLIVHLFFCTFPMRDKILDPNLVNPSFYNIFANLHRKSQQLKLAAFLNYFHLLHQIDMNGSVTIHRKVYTNVPKISDWLKSNNRLCEFKLNTNGIMQNYNKPAIMNCFSSAYPCQAPLGKSNGQEAAIIFCHPEILLTSIVCEKMQDNEAIHFIGSVKVASIKDLQKNPCCVLESESKDSSVIYSLMDSTSYNVKTRQYQECNILRELNKCLVGFQKHSNMNEEWKHRSHTDDDHMESMPSNEPTNNMASTTIGCLLNSTLCTKPENIDSKNECRAMIDLKHSDDSQKLHQKPPLPPLRRNHVFKIPNSSQVKKLFQVSSEEDDYWSAQESFERLSADENKSKPEVVPSRRKHRKTSFAQRLKEAVAREQVFIQQANIEEAQIAKEIIAEPLIIDINTKYATSRENLMQISNEPRISRRLSVGFSLDVECPNSPTELTKEGFCISQDLKDSGNSTEIMALNGPSMNLHSSDESDSEDEESYSDSFSSDYNSDNKVGDAYEDLEEILYALEENPEKRIKDIEIQSQSTLKRCFSDTFKEHSSLEPGPKSSYSHHRSLSLHGNSSPEVLQPQTTNICSMNQDAIVTGNWGCGSLGGDSQMKALLQWAASSLLNVSTMEYYTYNSNNLLKLGIVVRMISDRGWTVGQLVSNILKHCQAKTCRKNDQKEFCKFSVPFSNEKPSIYGSHQNNLSLFDELIGPIANTAFEEDDDLGSYSVKFESNG